MGGEEAGDGVGSVGDKEGVETVAAGNGRGRGGGERRSGRRRHVRRRGRGVFFLRSANLDHRYDQTV